MLTFLLFLSLMFQQPGECPDAPPPRLHSGMTARVTPGDPNTMRSEAGLDGTSISMIPGGEAFYVGSNPICADGYWWYQVLYDETWGYTAEGANDNYWLEPYCSGVPIILNQPARSWEYEPITLYDVPDYEDRTEIGSIPPDTLLDVTAIYCEVSVWVQVEYEGQTGWIDSVYTPEISFGGDYISYRVESEPALPVPVEDYAERLAAVPVFDVPQDAITAQNVANIQPVQSYGQPNVSTFEWAADGQTIAVATANIIRVYAVPNLETPLHTLDAHTSNIRSMRYTADGRLFFSLDGDNMIDVWDAQTYELITSFQLEDDSVVYTILINDESTLLGLPGSHDTSYIYDIRQNIPTLLYSVEGKILKFTQNYVLTNAYRLNIYDIETGVLAREIGYGDIIGWAEEGEDRFTMIFHLTEGGDSSYSYMTYYSQCNIDTGRCDYGYEINTEYSNFNATPFRPEVLMGVNGENLWYIINGETYNEFGYNNDLRYYQQRFSQDVAQLLYTDNYAVIGGKQGEIRLYDEDGESHVLYGIVGAVRRMAFNADETLIAATGADNSLRIWDVETGNRISSLQYTNVGTMIKASDNHILTSNRVLDTQSGSVLQTANRDARFIGFVLDGRPLYRDNNNNFWIEDVMVFAGQPDVTYTFSSDMRRVSYLIGNTITIRSIETGEILQEINNFRPIMPRSFSPDNRLLLGSYRNNSQDNWGTQLFIYDVATGDLLLNITPQDSWSYETAWSPDSRLLIVTTYLGAEIHDLTTQSLILFLEGVHERSFTTSLDNSVLALGTYEGDLRLIDLSTGEVIHEIVDFHPTSIANLIFQGNRLYSNDVNGTIQAWEIP